ncbi:multi-sensor hybrid histidine kinase [Candidatus Magnetomorum sp. HK-1]|nr:multi-sensor hybrid histidine kinase [Candidatus Magnetomorum sp. HK-1]
MPLSGPFDTLDLIDVKTTKLATQLTLSFFVAMVAPMIIATLFSIVYFSNEIRNHAMQKMHSEGKMAKVMYRNALNNIQQLADVYAKRNDVELLLSYALGKSFQKDLIQRVQADQIDMLTVVDISRKVVIRTHSPSLFGDTLSEFPYLVKALSGKFSTASEIFSQDRMRREGFHLPPGISNEPMSLVMFTSAAPVYNRKKTSIIGAVIIRKILEPSGELIRTLSETLSMTTGMYQGTHFIGSFLENRDTYFRPVPLIILKKTLSENMPTLYKEFHQEGYMSLCLPIENFYNQPIAIIVIQRAVHPYIKAQYIAIMTHLVILSMAILLGVFFRRRIEHRILFPVRQLQDGVKQIRDGDYQHRLSVTGIEEIESLALAFNDMTIELQDKQEFLKRAEKKYRGIFENAVEGIFQMTPDGRFLDVNPSMARILGYDSQKELLAEITDLAKQSFVRPDDLSEFKHILAEKLQIIDFETQLYQKNGQKRWCSISARAVFDIEGEVLIKGDLLYYEGTLLNITNRKERQRAERARNAAELANKSKTDFLARMSHEIRTPMNAILGMAEMLQKSSLNSEQKRYVDLFSSSGELLLNIINDILDFSKIEAGQLSIEKIEFDLIEVIENIGKVLSFKAHEKALELVIHIDSNVPRFVIGDPVRLQQILINLTGNAIKFTKKGEVILQISLDMKNNGSFLFTVQDTGIGIDPSYHNTIFERFSQADTSITRHYGGTGLGLAISKKLVELMEGNIWFKSNKGEGTVFYFTLSLPPVNRQDYISPQTLQKFIGKNVLIIEQNMSSAKALAARLTYWHIHVDCFNSAKMALHHIQHIPDTPIPDLIFINQRLSDGNPFELKQQIMDELSSRPLFIILFSSDNDIDKKNHALKYGFDAFLNKPIIIEELDRAVNLSIHQEVTNQNKTLTRKQAIIECDNPLNILVADDHLSNRKVIEMFLKNDPINIDFAENGQIAVEKFRSKIYDMIFMDMEMPVLNGLNATKMIREIEQMKENQLSVPIIFLTAHALEKHRKQCFEAGGTACLTKPVKSHILIETIQQYAPVSPSKEYSASLESVESVDFIEDDLFAQDMNTENFDMPDFSDVDIQEGIAELIPFFIESTQKDLEQIKTAINENDLQTVRRIGHSLKGSSGAYGQEGIGQIGESIETAALSGENNLINAHIDELETALTQLKNKY